MTARIYTGADARALREAAPPGRWHLDGDVRDANDQRVALVATGHPMSSGTFDLLVAAPDLAASVEHHEARAARAEAEVERLTRALGEARLLAQPVDPEERLRFLLSLDAATERDALRAAVREFLAAREAWAAWPDCPASNGTAFAVKAAEERALDALRALVPAEAPDAR